MSPLASCLLLLLVACGSGPAAPHAEPAPPAPATTAGPPPPTAACSEARPEVCDGRDNDCDGRIDEADPDMDRTSLPTWYVDLDEDGHGDRTDPGVRICSDPTGETGHYVRNNADCDDLDPAVGPGTGGDCPAPEGS